MFQNMVNPASRKFPICCPHLIWHTLLKKNMISISTEAVSKFWDWFKSRNVDWSLSFPSTHVPLALYGDGAQYTVFLDSVIAVSLSCPLMDDGPVSKTR